MLGRAGPAGSVGICPPLLGVVYSQPPLGESRPPSRRLCRSGAVAFLCRPFARPARNARHRLPAAAPRPCPPARASNLPLHALGATVRPLGLSPPCPAPPSPSVFFCLSRTLLSSLDVFSKPSPQSRVLRSRALRAGVPRGSSAASAPSHPRPAACARRPGVDARELRSRVATGSVLPRAPRAAEIGVPAAPRRRAPSGLHEPVQPALAPKEKKLGPRGRGR